MQTSLRFLVSLLIVLVGVMGAIDAAHAGTMGLAWDSVPDSDLAGYKVYYGTAPDNYTQSVDVGNQTSATLNGLAACTIYYTAIKAYDTGELESASFSNEVSGFPAPVVSSVSPTSAEQGSSMTLSIVGESFDGSANVEISGSGITVDSVSVVSCTQLSVQITVGAGASPGARDVTVVNGDNSFGTLGAGFSVGANIAPSVASASPIDGETDVAVDVAPTVSFSETMDPATITSGNVRLLDLSGQPVAQAAGSPSLAPDGVTATITPAADLGNEVIYQIHVTGGGSGVADLNGATMASDFHQNPGFTTAAAADTAGPTVATTSPADGATDVSLSVQPQLTFDEELDPASVTGSTVLIVDAGGAPVAHAIGSPQLSPDGKTVTVIPAADLAENSVYRARAVGGAAGVTDLAGNPLATTFDQATGFTTVNLPPGTVSNNHRTDVR